MLEIKALTSDQYEEWYPLWQGYLTFYETSLPNEIAKNNWARFFDDNEPVGAIGAFKDGKMVGFVHYIFHRTNWSLTRTCYLQDLFADPTVRGEGIGRALIEAVYSKAKENGAEQVYWMTQNHNKTARVLYDRIADDNGFMVYEKEL
ncbi:MAG: GNAT family N-acetyltransferase [Emcibacteraceae bacterium]|nr:GNAT family N-acetyltransferase [Emcibacteraceae bacterium]MDG1996215.1 GNAT family N-acetyltransferase [Emcibacteraceae bacterium]